MALNLELHWHKPVALRNARADEPLEMMCDDLEQITDGPGAYVFGRRFGGVVVPLYIGQAKNIQKRIRQHLERNVKLVKAIKTAKNGARVIIACELSTKPGQQLKKCLEVLERSLFRSALAAGHELVNVQGVREKHHQLEFRGSKRGTAISGKSVFAPTK